MRLSFGDCVFDPDTREVFRARRLLSVSPKAFALLDLLIACRPRAVSKEDIHARLWPGTHVSDANLANLVVELRAALGDAARKPRILRTVARFGYAFSARAALKRESARGEPGAPGLAYRLVWGHREIGLDPGDNLVGRDQDAVVWIDDESVSRRHARISIGKEGATIEDLGSKNGTFVGSQRVDGTRSIGHGDVITVASVKLTVRALQAPTSTETEPDKRRVTD